MMMATFTRRFQVSGVRCQQLKSTRWIDVGSRVGLSLTADEFSLNPSLVQAQFGFLLTPET